MSDSSPSPQPAPEEQIHDSDAVCEGSPSSSPSLNQETLNQETLNRRDPTPKSDPDHTPPPQRSLVPEYNSPDEEDDDDDEEADEETTAGPTLRVDPPIAALNVSARDATLSPPSHGPSARRGTTAGKPKKGKRSKMKQQAIQRKLETLMSNLNPIPFIPHKILDFAKHEKLMKKLGLWGFANIDFDRNIRTDLLAQLIASYKAKCRSSRVNDYRININRTDLARAFELQLPKKGSNVGGGTEADSESEPLPDESIGFITELVDNWVLLHEDAWIMPKEVTDWLQMIRDGHPEKVDWASLFWFMVEKEVKQGVGLRDCYYASHLQHLIKWQREELFLTGDVEEDDKGAEIISLEEEGPCLTEGGPSTELTLGKDDDEKGGEGILKTDVEMMDVEKCKGNDDHDDVEKEVEEEGVEIEARLQWVLEGKKEIREHFMRPCSAGNAEESEGFELKNEDEDEGEIGEEEERDQFHNFQRGDDEGFTGNFLGAMDMDQLGFNPHDPLEHQSSHMSTIPPFFNNSGKRVVEHDHCNEGNKKLRINNTELWDHHHNKPPLDLGAYIEQIQHMAERARVLHEEKEQAWEHLNENQQILLNELQKRDSVIEHLDKTRVEEMQKKDGEIYRLERELYFMGDVLEGYRKALKETQRAFSEYREKARVPEEPTYKDTGEGGLMLTNGGIENLRRKREDEFKMQCLFVEQKMKEVKDDLVGQFVEFDKKVGQLDTRLSGLEDDVAELGERQRAKQSGEREAAEVVEEAKATEENVVEDDEEKVVEDDEVEGFVSEKVVEDDEEGSVSEKVVEDDEEEGSVSDNSQTEDEEIEETRQEDE